MARRRKVTLDYLVDKMIVEVVEKYTADCDPKEMSIKTADFVNAIKVIADLKGLKVVPDNTFKGIQEASIEVADE